MKYLKFIIIYTLTLLPVEYIALSIDYYTFTMWGYILLLIISIGTGIIISIYGIKKYVFLLITRSIGIFFSWLCTKEFMNINITSYYFKPLDTLTFSLFLGIISIIITLITLKISNSLSSE
ncbi:hypothetical protein AST05_08000 [Staphylococcus equorum]|nr:hypothetical protein AST05_08000 [Staphylococcus equorum]